MASRVETKQSGLGHEIRKTWCFMLREASSIFSSTTVFLNPDHIRPSRFISSGTNRRHASENIPYAGPIGDTTVRIFPRRVALFLAVGLLAVLLLEYESTLQSADGQVFGMASLWYKPAKSHDAIYNLIASPECRPHCRSRWRLVSSLLTYFGTCKALRSSSVPAFTSAHSESAQSAPNQRAPNQNPAFASADVMQSRVALLVPWNEITVGYRGALRNRTLEEYRGLLLPVDATDILPFCAFEQIMLKQPISDKYTGGGFTPRGWWIQHHAFPYVAQLKADVIYLPRTHTFRTASRLSRDLRDLLDSYEVLMTLHPTPLHPRPRHQTRVYQAREPHCAGAHLAPEVRAAGYCVNTLDNYVLEEQTLVSSTTPPTTWRKVPHWYKWPIKQMTKEKVPPLEGRESKAFLPSHNFNENGAEDDLRHSLPAGLRQLGVEAVVGPQGFGKRMLRSVKYVIMLDRKPSSGQVFAEAAMFGAVGIGNCDKLFPKMLFPTTCAKSLAEALLHVRRMEADPTQWTQASQYATRVMKESFDLESARPDLDAILGNLDCTVRTTDLPVDYSGAETAMQKCGDFFVENSGSHSNYMLFNDSEYVTNRGRD